MLVFCDILNLDMLVFARAQVAWTEGKSDFSGKTFGFLYFESCIKGGVERLLFLRRLPDRQRL